MPKHFKVHILPQLDPATTVISTGASAQSAKAEDQEYYFIHLTNQEYFVATEAKTWIRSIHIAELIIFCDGEEVLAYISIASAQLDTSH